MKRRIAALMALALSGSALLPAIPAYAAEDRLTDHGKTDYVVVAENPAVSMELEAAYEGSRISSDAGSVQQEGILALTLSDEEKSILENREDVHVEEDIILHACTALEPTDRVEETGDQGIDPEKQWNLDMIAASPQEITPGGNAADIKVAVIDSGVGFTTDIDVERSVNLIPGEEEVIPFYEDVTGHGTSVASVIAASRNETGATGVNPDVTLYSVKVLDENNQSPVSRVIQGIYWCIENDVDIINMSFGTSQYSEALRAAVKAADQEGILMIAAAGNTGNGNGTAVQYPAAFGEVMAVGSVNAQGQRSTHSATGEQVEIMAPGEDIPSTGFLDLVIQSDGTSLAASHVTGAASLLWSMNPDKSAAFIRSLLNESARAAGQAEEYGNGILDVKYAADHFSQAQESQDTDKASIPDNEQTPETFDEAYVNAYWASKDHENAVIVYGNNRTGLPADLVEYARLGIYQADHSTYLKGSTSNHESFHGLYNYVCGSVYLAQIAKSVESMGLGSALDTVGFPVANPSDPDYGINYFDNRNSSQQIKNTLTEFNTPAGWKDAIGSAKYSTLTSKRKAYFILGLAAHTAMDSLAHATFGYENGEWVKVNQMNVSYTGNSRGDDKNIIPNRWEVAKKVAYTIFDRYTRGQALDATVYYKPNDYADPAVFKLKKFNRHIKSNSMSLYQTYASWIETYSHD
ncbi:MAG: S8 family peptidase [Eubacterium sp.]|nr:S8 family peptidase [Eubacterium sp.]